MSTEEKKQPEKVEEDKSSVTKEELDKLKTQMEEQAKKLKEHEKEIQAKSEEYKQLMEQMDIEGAGMKGYTPLSSPSLDPMPADDFMMQVLDEAKNFEEIYQMKKRYNMHDPFQRMICEMQIDMEQGIPWDHVKRIYAKDLKKYNIIV